jgi:hypothetical protein
MAGKSPRWEVGDMVLFERWQNPSNLLGKRSLQTIWSRKASTSIVLLTELYTSENAINFGCPSAHFPLSSILCLDLVIFLVRVVTFCTAYPTMTNGWGLSSSFCSKLEFLDRRHPSYSVPCWAIGEDFLIKDETFGMLSLPLSLMRAWTQARKRSSYPPEPG